jgi:threonyl-tRNA synthetase
VSQLAQFMLQTFGYKEYVIELSVRDPKNTAKYVGSDESWVKAEEALLRALQREGLAFTRMEGEAKFYGPAIDIKVKDALGRAWQGPTIQVDFNFPERFDLNYIAEDGQQKRPVMVHRTVLGSMERFIAGLVEHYAGAFPVWLAPVQAALVPIADRHNEYAHNVARKLKDAGYRVVVDDSSERMNNKIRKAQNDKIPYMLVIGDREMEAGAVAVRKRTGEDLKAKPLDEFLAMLAEDVKGKVIW